jgi:hypothetical protein
VETPLGAALGITTVPGRGVDREHQGPILWTVLNQQLAELAVVHVTGGQGLVEAAVRSAELRFETQ